MKTVLRHQFEAMDFVNTWAAVKEDKPYTFEAVPFKRPQTAEQQAKFHCLCREYARTLKLEHGIDTNLDGVKEYLKDEYGPTEPYVTPSGKGRARIMSSTKWNLDQTSEMIEHLLRDAAERGIVLE